MTDIEDELRRLLVGRAAEVEPHLSGHALRELAGRRQAQRRRTVALPTAAAVLAAALLITPFVLIHHGDSAPHRPATIVPAGSSVPSSGARTPPYSPPQVTAPTTRAPRAVPSRPAAVSSLPSSAPGSAAVPRPSSTGVAVPPVRPTASSSPGTTLPTPTPTR